MCVQRNVQDWAQLRTGTRAEERVEETDMRYESKKDLPATVTQVLPDDAQKVYLETYNRAWDEHNQETKGDMSRHSVAHRQGWATIQRAFERDPNSGAWQRKGEQAAEYDARSFLEKVRDALASILSKH
jgi:cation transport regulator ChaB